MPENREHARWYWHCPACDRYVPREQLRCVCGAPKVRRASPAGGKRPMDTVIAWEAAALLVLAGLSLLWLLLK